eukprot:scaffold35907_cov237-Amphora_coffeaeformis.AAC.1
MIEGQTARLPFDSEIGLFRNLIVVGFKEQLAQQAINPPMLFYVNEKNPKKREEEEEDCLLFPKKKPSSCTFGMHLPNYSSAPAEAYRAPSRPSVVRPSDLVAVTVTPTSPT